MEITNYLKNFFESKNKQLLDYTDFFTNINKFGIIFTSVQAYKEFKKKIQKQVTKFWNKTKKLNNNTYIYLDLQKIKKQNILVFDVFNHARIPDDDENEYIILFSPSNKFILHQNYNANSNNYDQTEDFLNQFINVNFNIYSFYKCGKNCNNCKLGLMATDENKKICYDCFVVIP